MIEVLSVEEVLAANIPALEIVPLHALQADTRDPYRTIILQPQGKIQANNVRIGHADADLAVSLCGEFLSKSTQTRADITVAPEYCVPWRLIEQAIDGGNRPSSGAIWILGCESITPAGLLDIKRRCIDAGIFLHAEDLDERQVAQKVYLDPLVYIFWGRDGRGTPKLCIFVQFKTAPCRDYHDVENDALLLGKVMYTINKGQGKIGLFSFICSDAFEETEFLDDIRYDSIIFHIQLNPRPAHGEYAVYRNKLVSYGSQVEILCVNWASNVEEIKENGKRDEWKNVAGSAWYAPPKNFSADDLEIDSLHAGGLYYCMFLKRWHVLFLNFSAQILLVQKQKLMFTRQQALAPRSFVRVEKRWAWDSSDNCWRELNEPDDGFAEVVSCFAATSVDLLAAKNTSPIALERSLEMLVGPTGNPSTWFNHDELVSLQLNADEESIQRVTVGQEVLVTRPGVIFRRERLQRANDAIQLHNRVAWPEPVADLSGGYTFSWDKRTPFYNVTSAASGRPATLVFLSDQADDQIIENARSKVQASIHSSIAERLSGKPGSNIGDAAIRAYDRLCIVYRRDHSLHVYKDPESTRFDRGAGGPGISYTGDNL